MRLPWIMPLLSVMMVAGCGGGIAMDANPSQSPAAPASASLEPLAPTITREPSALASPIPSLAPSGRALGVVSIPFAGREMEVAIVGEPGVVVAWRAATERELRAAVWRDDEVALNRLTDHDVVLGWIGTICDVNATLAVARDRLVVSPVPREGCDAMAIERGVVLTFATPVEPGAVVATLEPTVLLPEHT